MNVHIHIIIIYYKFTYLLCVNNFIVQNFHYIIVWQSESFPITKALSSHQKIILLGPWQDLLLFFLSLKSRFPFSKFSFFTFLCKQLYYSGGQILYNAVLFLKCANAMWVSIFFKRIDTIPQMFILA